MPVQKSIHEISAPPDLATHEIFKSLYQLHLKASFVKRGNSDLIYVLEDDLLGKDLVSTQIKSKLKFFIEFFACPKRRFQENACTKNRLEGS